MKRQRALLRTLPPSERPDPLSHLPGWGLTRVLFGLPKPLRDAVFNLVARNRYRIFGKYESCFMPDVAMRGRVLE
jgi:predicted DCC family thiol-disulfide oxidoreductase YuxK